MPTSFDYSLLGSGVFTGLWDAVRIMWPVLPLLIALFALKLWISSKDEERRQAKVYNDERNRERARHDERRDQNDANR